MDEDDMADFIEEDSPDENEDENRDARVERKRAEKAARRKKAAGFAMGGLDITAEYAIQEASSRRLTDCPPLPGPGTKFKKSSETVTTTMMPWSPMTRTQNLDLLSEMSSSPQKLQSE